MTVHTIEWEDLRDLVKKPVYVGIQDTVIRSPHRIRPPRAGDEPRPETDKTSQEDKPQTRIPVPRFRHAVERVQREKRESREANEQKRKKESPRKPRRSSIPKLRERIPVARNNSIAHDGQTVKIESEPVKEAKDDTPVKTKDRKPVKRDRIPGTVMKKDHYKITKKVDHERKSNKKDDNIDTNKDQMPVKIKQEELDDEFDKLYEEIVDDDATSLPDEILETKVKDPKKLESKFEEIVHQYDEESVEQVKIEPTEKARYSKIPLLRRRSSHDVKVPKRSDRRLSLKTGIIKSMRVGDEKNNDSLVNIKADNKTPNGIREDNRVGPSQDADANEQEEVVETNNNENHYIATLSPQPMPFYNTIATPESELVKVGIFGISSREIPLENNVKQNKDVATPEPETVKIAVIDSPVKEKSKDINKEVEVIIGQTHEFTKAPKYISEVEDSTSNTSAIDKPEVNNEISIEIHNIGKQIIIEEKKGVKDVIEQKETIKTATINNDTVLQSEEHHINISQKDILIHNLQDELKSFSLLKNTNAVEERTKSRYINKPFDTEEKINNANIATLEEDIPIVKGKVSRILKRLTSHEYSTNTDEDIDIKKEDIEIKTLTVDNIPKKSVLSKIAMFERAEAEPSMTKKQTQRYSKPKRTISEEMRHSPKIVHEVLKPNDTEQIDKYKIVNIDIIKPIEVITNNQEQVTVVENLAEETFVYDNFDVYKSIGTEPTDSSIRDKNETILVDDNRLLNVESKELEVAKEELTFANGEESIQVNYVKPDNSRLYNNYNKYKVPETKDVASKETYDVASAKHKIKDQITRDNCEPTLLNTESNKNRLYHQKDKAEKWKSTGALSDFLPVKEKINRLKSYDDSNMKKAKSTAELDLGNVVKGKVKNIIVRMNSFDLLDDVKQKETVEVIDVKERPRKKSVSEKIALFERKLIPVAMQDVTIDSGRSLNIDAKPVKQSINSVPTESTNVTNIEEYAAKVKELTNAKLTYGSVGNMSYVELKDGRKMPVLALGTALLDPRLAKHIVAAAIDLGYRAIDTAFIYGNEREVGEGIRAKIQDGTVRREDLFIMSKLWSTFHRPDLVEPACRASLAATGLEYFDLYMIHNPMSFKEGDDPIPKIANVIQYSAHDYLEAWFAMEELVPKGLARSIGVSNFNSAQLARVIEKGRVKPVINQVECHPYLSQERLSSFCDARDVRLSCFGALGSKGTPAEFKSSQAAAIDDPLVQVMAAGLGISPAQLLIRYQIDSGHNVVVKASSAAHLWDNLQALGTSLKPAQVAALNALNTNKRAFTFRGMGDTHRNYPFRAAF